MSEAEERRRRVEAKTFLVVRIIAWIAGVACVLLGIFWLLQAFNSGGFIAGARGVAALLFGGFLLQYVLRPKA